MNSSTLARDPQVQDRGRRVPVPAEPAGGQPGDLARLSAGRGRGHARHRREQPVDRVRQLQGRLCDRRAQRDDDPARSVHATSRTSTSTRPSGSAGRCSNSRSDQASEVRLSRGGAERRRPAPAPPPPHIVRSPSPQARGGFAFETGAAMAETFQPKFVDLVRNYHDDVRHGAISCSARRSPGSHELRDRAPARRQLLLFGRSASTSRPSARSAAARCWPTGRSARADRRDADQLHQRARRRSR